MEHCDPTPSVRGRNAGHYVQRCRSTTGKQRPMNTMITLVGLTGPHQDAAAGMPVRPLEPGDVPELSSVQRHAYAGDPKQAPVGITGWRGSQGVEGLGRTIEEASLVASGPDGQITAAIVISERDGEAVIAELFTHPEHRRQGLAEELLRHGMHVLHTLGHATVTVTVEDNNSAAMALYLSRDFRRLTDEDPDSDYD